MKFTQYTRKAGLFFLLCLVLGIVEDDLIRLCLHKIILSIVVNVGNNDIGIPMPLKLQNYSIELKYITTCKGMIMRIRIEYVFGNHVTNLFYLGKENYTILYFRE